MSYKQQTIEAMTKHYKLSPIMVQAVGRMGTGNRYSVRTVTIAALIERGILTAMTPATGAQHLLTDLGVQLFKDLGFDGLVPEWTEAHVKATTVARRVR